MSQENHSEGIEKPLLTYYYRHDCGTCDALHPKVKEMVETDFPALEYREVNVEASPALAAQNMVFTVPVLTLQYEGGEVFRMVRSFSLIEVEKKISRFLELAGLG